MSLPPQLVTEEQFHGSRLRQAVELAQEHGWTIVAESETRLLRHALYDPEHWNLVPTE